MYKFRSLLPLLFLTSFSFAQQKDYNLLVGTYTNNGKSEGIYVYNFNSGSAESQLRSVTKGVINPSYLALGTNNKFVYAVNEDGKKSAVSAFVFNPVQGKLNFINTQATQGEDPCYLIADDRHVISANYSGGSISVFGITATGGLTPVQQLVKHTGSSIDSKRQSSPHVHMVQFTPDKKQLIVNDLGTDMVYLYDYQANKNSDILKLRDSVPITPGGGPRHLTFSRDGKYAYLLHEMDGGLTVFSLNEGKLEKIQETMVTEPGFKGENGGADIHISPDQRFLYASNRGTENKIIIFAIEKGGLLSKIASVATEGKGPRNFVIDPTGKYVLVGHQYTNNIVIFERNPQTGNLKDTGKRINVGAPVCLVFSPIK